MRVKQSLKSLLIDLYPEEAESLHSEIMNKVSVYFKSDSPNPYRRAMSNSDCILITYPHQIQGDQKPLTHLSKFYNTQLKKHFSGVHILPFYPSTSDGGFAVTSYNQVDPNYGDWSDIAEIEGDLMFDAVFNHTSSQHPWFQKWLLGDSAFDNYYHMFEHRPENGSDEWNQLKMVTRPRSSDLLTEFQREGKSYFVWSTFGPDQLDVDFSNSKVLLEFVDLLILYLEQGATLLRVDAVPFLWKELGTNCMHLPQTHKLVKVFRSVLDLIKPEVQVITESNVPHEENISYLGNGFDEAQLVYNFSLAPLILHAMVSGSCHYLKTWVTQLKPMPEGTCFFNFTATHDGIGVRPLEGILTDEEIESFAESMKSQGGMISYREFEGGQRPYEVNITWASALKIDDIDLHVRRILCSYAMSFVFPGVPGVYFHNLFGSQNWMEGYEQTQHRRDINRKMFQDSEIEAMLKDSVYHGKIFQGTMELLKIRQSHSVFHPEAVFCQLASEDHIWAVERSYADQKGLFIFNVSDRPSDYQGRQLKAYEYFWELI